MKCLVLSNIPGHCPALQAVLAAEDDADRILYLGDRSDRHEETRNGMDWAVRLQPPDQAVSSMSPAGLGPLRQFHLGRFLCLACRRVSGQPLRRRDFERLRDRHWNSNELARMHSDLILTGVPDKLFVLVGHPDFLFLGDGDEPLLMELNGTVIVNPGSLCSSTGDGQASYALWEDGAVTLRRLSYASKNMNFMEWKYLHD